MTLYAIGDVHGQIDRLHETLEWIEADRAREGTRDAPLIQVGDLVDRGAASNAGVGFLRDLVASDPRVQVLKGNHDQMFTTWLETGDDSDAILRDDLTYFHHRIGGRSTLASYGITIRDTPNDHLTEAREAVPQSHRTFLTERPLCAHHGDIFFAHAGILPGTALKHQCADDLTWIRQPFLEDTREHGALIVHGHTPVERVEHHGNRLAIDTGAAYGGPLSAVAIETGRRVYLLTPRGRVEVKPHAAP